MKTENLRKLLIMALFLIFIFLFAAAPSGETNDTEDPQSTLSGADEKLLIKTVDDRVCLIKSGDILKEYDIDIRLLPGEDILMLEEGISVKSEAEADLIAEDYDG